MSRITKERLRKIYETPYTDPSRFTPEEEALGWLFAEGKSLTDGIGGHEFCCRVEDGSVSPAALALLREQFGDEKLGEHLSDDEA